MKDTTKILIDSITLDLFPDSFAARVDFGLDRGDIQKAYSALHYGYRHEEFIAAELDLALGNGRMLTSLIHRGNNPYAKDLIITTAWDDIPEEDDE